MSVEDIHIQELLKELDDITVERMGMLAKFYDTITKIQASRNDYHQTEHEIVELVNLCKQNLEVRSVLQSRRLGIGEQLSVLQAGDIVRNAEAIELSCENATEAISAAIKEKEGEGFTTIFQAPGYYHVNNSRDYNDHDS
jgi:hypothetical protein